MKAILRLHLRDDTEMWLNYDHIVSICPVDQGDGAIIACVNGKEFSARDTPDEIIRRLRTLNDR